MKKSIKIEYTRVHVRQTMKE